MISELRDVTGFRGEKIVEYSWLKSESTEGSRKVHTIMVPVKKINEVVKEELRKLLAD